MRNKWYILMKFLELVIIILMIGLTHKSHDVYYIDYYLLTSGSFVGYCIIISGEMVGLLLSSPVSRNLDITLSIVGSVLFIAGGSLVIVEFIPSSNTFGIIAGVFAIATAITFVVDAVMLIKYEN